MKKISTILIIFSILFSTVPSSVFASEGLFYYFENQNGLSSFKKNYKKIDVIAPQLYIVNDDLKLEKPASKDKLLSAAKKKKNVDIVPLVANKGFSRTITLDLLRHPDKQDALIKELVKEGKKKKYKGWQYDFENIFYTDRQLYVDFVAKTYVEMKKNKLEFSVAVVPRQIPFDPNSSNQDWSSAYDYKKLAENSDFLSLMTYDDAKAGGPVSSMSFVNGVLDFMINTEKISPDKLSLGIPFYCWKWQVGASQKTKSTTYDNALDAYKNAVGVKSNGYDEKHGAEYFTFYENNINYTIWCDNDKSIEKKLSIVDDRGLKGYSVWALGQEPKHLWKKIR